MRRIALNCFFFKLYHFDTEPKNFNATKLIVST